MAPYCAIPRDYLSDTPPIARYGVLVSQHGQLGAIPPPPFSERFPIGEHAKWRCDTPPQKGYLSDTCAIPYENKAKTCDTPLCDTISKGSCKRYGGVSRTGPHLMAHQMKNLFVFSVFECVEGAFGAASGGTPEMQNGAPRDELKNGRGRGCQLGPSLIYSREPPFLARRHFSGRGVEVYSLRPHAAGISFTPPPFYTHPPPLEGHFQG